MSWGARLLIALALVLAGAAAAAWALARYDGAARFFGVVPAEHRQEQTAVPATILQVPASDVAAQERRSEARIAQLEARLRRVENSTQRVEGSAGRADALLVAFAARRAIDRGVALGYLEPVIVDRFGTSNPRAVATIVTGSQTPIRLSDLVAQYRELGSSLRSSAPGEGLWAGFRRELGSLIQIRRTDRPSLKPEARYERALALLEDGEADAALAETMRLPGAARADDWIRKARDYVAVHRALDEIESAALLGRTRQPVS